MKGKGKEEQNEVYSSLHFTLRLRALVGNTSSHCSCEAVMSWMVGGFPDDTAGDQLVG